jgi:hypothetical protein
MGLFSKIVCPHCGASFSKFGGPTNCPRCNGNLLIPVKPPPSRMEIGERLKNLPDLALKKAVSIERNYRAWSVLLAIWLFIGFFNIIANFNTMSQYRTGINIIKNASSPLFSVKPEAAELIWRLKPHLTALERLNSYYLIVTIMSILAWLLLFPIRGGFVQRKQRGPTYLLILLAAEVLVHAYGGLLSIPIPMADTVGFVDLFTIRVLPLILGIIMLTLIPFYGRAGAVFCQYTAVDSKCFMKDGVGLEVLEGRQE